MAVIPDLNASIFRCSWATSRTSPFYETTESHSCIYGSEINFPFWGLRLFLQLLLSPVFPLEFITSANDPKCSHCRIRKSLIVLSWWFNVCFPVSLLSFLCPLLGSCLWWPRLIIETTLGAPRLAGWLGMPLIEWVNGDGGKRVFPVLVRPVPLTEGSVCGCLIWWIMRMEQLKIQRSLFLLFFRSNVPRVLLWVGGWSFFVANCDVNAKQEQQPQAISFHKIIYLLVR